MIAMKEKKQIFLEKKKTFAVHSVIYSKRSLMNTPKAPQT